MIYADTDFFMALLKGSDWLKEKAMRRYQENRGKIVTSATTIIELLILADRYGLDPETITSAVFEIASEVKGMSQTTAMQAVYHIKEDKMHIFDSFHASYGFGMTMLSSDKIFDKIGMDRIALEE